jgi:tRNA/tmRNA/rRNA uracil-C5-methylase (TrmA/RlmC/RlmD family)
MHHYGLIPYAEILQRMPGFKASDQSNDAANIEPFAFMPYTEELSGKKNAFAQFWKKNRLPGMPEGLIGSPMPRHYRTTTKRRVFFSHGKFRLRFSHLKDATPDTAPLSSELEPKEHAVIYGFAAEKINSPSFSMSAKHLNYIIIRGTYTEFCVVFNVHQINGPIVKNLRALAEKLSMLGLNIVSAFIFADPSRSDYYLDKTETEGDGGVCKKLFGPDALRLRVNDQTYNFGPLSFSQINQSMLPVMLEKMVRMCGSDPKGRFVDLYCGYGLFANYIGRGFGETIAVDVDRASVDYGHATAQYTARKKGTKSRMIFRAAPITPMSLEKLLPLPGEKAETVLLDPPRGGPSKGVIAFCAAREPRRIIHLFCDIDRVPVDLEEWEKNGYRVTEIVPFDMFPGTPNLEVAVLLEADEGFRRALQSDDDQEPV